MKNKLTGKFFQNMMLQTKLIYSYLFVVMLPVIFIGYFFISQTTKETLAHTNYVNDVNLKQIKNNVTNILSNYIQLSDNIFSDPQLNNYLEKEYPADCDYGIKYFDFYELSKTYNNKMVFQNVSGINISVYTSNIEILHDNDFIFPLESQIGSSWYKEFSNSRNPISVGTPFISDKKKCMIPMSRRLEFSITDKYTNILKLSIPESQLYKMIENESENKIIYILNDENIILTSTDRNSVGMNFYKYKELGGNYSDLKSLTKDIILNGEDETVYFGIIDLKNFSKCKIISIVSTKPILKKINEITRYSLIICLISVVITISFVIIFSSKLTSRLKKLVTNMGKIRDGSFDVFVSYDEGDEIGELSRSFKNMIDRVNDLISKVYTNELHIKTLEIKSREAEIHALQSQINPHFLFNSMESIRVNLMKNQDYETSSIIESLARLLRKSIDWKSDNLPLRHEIDLVENYLKIQKFRYRHRLDYSLSIAEEYRDILIPKFSIQPLVENAIFHGIEMKKNGGFLKIYTETYEFGYSIVIEDNGVGMPEETLSALRFSLDNWNSGNSSGSIGIINVHQRLKLLFGREYGLIIESTVNSGTTVRMNLPAKNGKGGLTHV